MFCKCMNLESKYIKYLSKNYKLQFGGWEEGDSFVVHDPELYPNNDGPSGKVLYKNEDGSWHVMYGDAPSDLDEKYMIPLIENPLESNQQRRQQRRQSRRQSRQQQYQQPQQSSQQPRKQPRQQPYSSMP